MLRCYLKQQMLHFLVVQWLGLGALTAVARVQSLIAELRSCKAHSTAKKIQNKTNNRWTPGLLRQRLVTNSAQLACSWTLRLAAEDTWFPRDTLVEPPHGGEPGAVCPWCQVLGRWGRSREAAGRSQDHGRNQLWGGESADQVQRGWSSVCHLWDIIFRMIFFPALEKCLFLLNH